MAKEKETKETTEETTVVVRPKGEELNKQLKAAMAVIDKKLMALGYQDVSSAKAAKKPIGWKTTGSFKYNENDSNTINILTHMDGIYLGKCLAKMKRVRKEYNETMEELGLKTYPTCMWYGQTVDNWITDLERLVLMRLNANTIDELLKSKKELEQFLSQEDRLETALTKISGLLKV